MGESESPDRKACALLALRGSVQAFLISSAGEWETKIQQFLKLSFSKILNIMPRKCLYFVRWNFSIRTDEGLKSQQKEGHVYPKLALAT